MSTTTRTLVRTMPRSGRPVTHYGEPTGPRDRYIKLACTGRQAHGFVLDAERPGLSESGRASALRAIEAGVTCKSCKGERRAPIRDEAPLLHPSLLSARDRATLHPQAQIAKLVRIGRRAGCHGDWIEECIATSGGRLLRPGPERDAALADVAASRARARAAADECLRVARTAGLHPEITGMFS